MAKGSDFIVPSPPYSWGRAGGRARRLLEADTPLTRAHCPDYEAGGVRFERLEARQHLAATLVGSFGTNGQLIGPAHAANTITTLLPYGDGSLFTFTKGNTLTRLLPNGRPDTRFAGDGSITIGGRNPIVAVAAAPDGSVYVEYGLVGSDGQTVRDIGFQHFLKTGRLDPNFGSRRLLDLSRYDRTTAFAAGPMLVTKENRLYYQGGANLYFIPDNGSVAGIRRTGPLTAGSRIIARPDGALYVLGVGVTAYNRNFQRIRTFGTAGAALGGSTIVDGAFDSDQRLIVTLADDDASQMVRLTTRGTLDQTFGARGAVTLPSGFLTAGVAFTGSHLLVRDDNSLIVAGGLTTISGTATTRQAALLQFDRRGREVSGTFSPNGNGTLTSQSGTLDAAEVNVAAGPNDTIYLSTIINRPATTGTQAYDFLEQFTFQASNGSTT